MQFISLTTDVDLADAQEKAQQVTSFLTTNDLKTIVDTGIQMALKFAGTILLALIVWFIGKKLVRMTVNFVGKILKRSELDIGVVKFLQSLTKFVGYIILAIIIIDILGFQTRLAGRCAGVCRSGFRSGFTRQSLQFCRWNSDPGV